MSRALYWSNRPRLFFVRALRSFEVDPNRAESAAPLLSRVLSLAALLLIAATWPLWTPQTVFPRVPFVGIFRGVPGWLEGAALGVGCCGLVLAFVAGSSRRDGPPVAGCLCRRSRVSRAGRSTSPAAVGLSVFAAGSGPGRAARVGGDRLGTAPDGEHLFLLGPLQARRNVFGIGGRTDRRRLVDVPARRRPTERIIAARFGRHSGGWRATGRDRTLLATLAAGRFFGVPRHARATLSRIGALGFPEQAGRAVVECLFHRPERRYLWFRRGTSSKHDSPGLADEPPG